MTQIENLRSAYFKYIREKDNARKRFYDAQVNLYAMTDKNTMQCNALATVHEHDPRTFVCVKNSCQTHFQKKTQKIELMLMLMLIETNVKRIAKTFIWPNAKVQSIIF